MILISPKLGGAPTAAGTSERGMVSYAGFMAKAEDGLMEPPRPTSPELSRSCPDHRSSPAWSATAAAAVLPDSGVVSVSEGKYVR